MRRSLALVAGSLVGLACAAACRAEPLCWEGVPKDGTAACPRCSCACARNPGWLALLHENRVRKLIGELRCGNSRQRAQAARKLGCRLHAGFCVHPEVLDALIDALLCDNCCEVRRAAAGSIEAQNGCTDAGLLALYLAANLDPNTAVRARAAEALDVLARGRGRGCGRLLGSGAALARRLRRVHYQPGSPTCRSELADACAGVAVIPAEPEAGAAQDRAERGPELLPNAPSPGRPGGR